ncbi:hypothetical protein BGZ61DRAFT_96625 [Ilyonectria robusta]|uniref:uncharacterized protein n=1 Tax=Ilyonectria robusta TaxID=1079257 RepID=UPI001E8D0690|nr:uncharacterized protein BGZ61DRAFT_96625 [Ilyonectria robusta]KAH8674867.1 hypothetical protein BGZ61DRAFT_96625 [Ilyonectria robusta]
MSRDQGAFGEGKTKSSSRPQSMKPQPTRLERVYDGNWKKITGHRERKRAVSLLSWAAFAATNIPPTALGCLYPGCRVSVAMVGSSRLSRLVGLHLNS